MSPDDETRTPTTTPKPTPAPTTSNAATPLEARIRDRGFTPSMRDADALVDLLASTDDDVVEDVERALARLGAPLVPRLLVRFEATRAPLRARVLKLAAKLGTEGSERANVRALLLSALGDADAKTRRNAASALGKASGEHADVEEALLAAWHREERVDHRRTLAASLGKMGSERALEALRAIDTTDEELSRIGRRAVLMLERTHGRARDEVSRIDVKAAPTEPRRVVARCRAGLEAIMVEELKGTGARVVAPGVVVLTLRAPISSLWNARTLLTFGFELPQEPIGEGSLADAVVRVLTSDTAWKIFRTFTEGPIRYRIEWAGGGHRRAVVWECAERVAAIRPELVNDPTQTTWEAVIHQRRGVLDVELRPRAIDDPRFTYRMGDVPAASHPTIAAALARLAGAREDDIVWDPFVGSGTELVERAALGRYAALFGSDMDPNAIAVARANLEAARIHAHLEEADATVYAPRGVTLILTNPPMGRRVVHHAELGALLQRFVEHAGKVLVKNGRMVWISPAPERTRTWAAAAGLVLELAQDVDMGGFTAQIQTFVKRAAPAKAPPGQGPGHVQAESIEVSSPRSPHRPRR